MNKKTHQAPISYFKLLKVVLSRWYWLILCLSVGLICCYTYLLFSPKLYRSSASLKFEDKKSEISELLNVRNLYDRTNKVESEKNIILSRTVLSSAIEAMDYRVAFFEKQNLQWKDTYPAKPINISIHRKETSLLPKHKFRYSKIDNRFFKLCFESAEQNNCEIYRYGKAIRIMDAQITITGDHLTSNSTNIFFQVVDPEPLLASIRKAIKIDDTQNTNILNIKYTGTNAQFCTDLVNAIITEYLNFDIRQKEAALIKTSEFLNVLLLEISEKAATSASALQVFKEANKLASVPSFFAAQQSVLETVQNENHLLEGDSKLIGFVSAQIVGTSPADSLTLNLQGLEDPQLQGLVEKHQEMILHRREKLNTFTSHSSPIIFLDQKIKDSRKSIINSLSNRLSLNLERSIHLKKLGDSVNKILESLPKIEKTVLALTSNFEIDQKIQTFLAQKKLETQIVNAAITAGATILDAASTPDEPIKPTPITCYLLAIIVSLASGVFGILIIHLYNPFIYTKQQITELSTIPILGVVTKSPTTKRNGANEIVIQRFPRSSFAESIRSIRGNLTFMAPEGAKTICITSETSGEGKSLIAINLAYALTLIQKKVILIAGDLRKSTLHTTFDISNQDGLSKYLSGQANIDAICAKTSDTYLDVISAGPNPPNPSELLQSPNMATLIMQLRSRYDIIIIDSAPVGLVSDVKPVMRYADINLFILRSGISKTYYTQTPEKLKVELNLSNIAIILNDFKTDNFHNHYYKDS